MFRCLDDAILDDGREALAARAHAELARVELESECARILAVAVREHLHLAGGLARFAPSLHHEHVVDGHAGDGVDTLGLQLLDVVDEAGQVLGRARRRERAGHGKQHDLLATEKIVG